MTLTDEELFKAFRDGSIRLGRRLSACFPWGKRYFRAEESNCRGSAHGGCRRRLL